MIHYFLSLIFILVKDKKIFFFAKEDFLIA